MTKLRLSRTLLPEERSPVRCAVLAVLVVLALMATLAGCSEKEPWKNLSQEQKIEDFEYLFDILKDNHPYLALKVRTDDYDWLAHRDEFEQAVRVAADDKAFAQAIARMLRQINNGHTGIVNAQLALDMAEWNEEPWKEAVAVTSPERIDYWCNLSVQPDSPSRAGGDRYPPFLAVYCGGEYVVVAVAPDEEIRGSVRPGMVVTEVDNRPVQEYVQSQRGLPLTRFERLRYDPIRKQLYQRQLVLPTDRESVTLAFLSEDEVATEVCLPYSSIRWDYGNPWPPSYSQGDKQIAPSLYTDVLADGTVGYVQITDFFQSDEDSLALRTFFEKVRDLPALIIDIRGNPGGLITCCGSIIGQLTPRPVQFTTRIARRDGKYAQRFVSAKTAMAPHEVITKDALVEEAGSDRAGNIPPEILTDEFANPLEWQYTLDSRNSLQYPGKIFVLVDDLSYSAADAFASLCKSSGFATLVGTWTGGDGLGLTPALVTLPNSGMVVRFPLCMGLNPDFTANEETQTTADVLVEQSPEDMAKYLEMLSGANTAGEGPDGLGPNPEWDTALRKCLELASQ